MPATTLGACRRRDTRTHDGVTLRVFPNLSNTLAYRFQLFLPIGLNRYLHGHAKEFDVAHLHACRNVPGAMAARHLLKAAVPYVLAPNGTAPDHRAAQTRQAWLRRLRGPPHSFEGGTGASRCRMPSDSSFFSSASIPLPFASCRIRSISTNSLDRFSAAAFAASWVCPSARW